MCLGVTLLPFFGLPPVPDTADEQQIRRNAMLELAVGVRRERHTWMAAYLWWLSLLGDAVMTSYSTMRATAIGDHACMRRFCAATGISRR
jgi:hypothetical protein